MKYKLKIYDYWTGNLLKTIIYDKWPGKEAREIALNDYSLNVKIEKL